MPYERASQKLNNELCLSSFAPSTTELQILVSTKFKIIIHYTHRAYNIHVTYNTHTCTRRVIITCTCTCIYLQQEMDHREGVLVGGGLLAVELLRDVASQQRRAARKVPLKTAAHLYHTAVAGHHQLL